ncbi:MAG: hypothetical protein SPI58_01990 [Candidatus Enteromonas sp.]|nr:hypothetical protein [Candidatus Enteromonas sp.]MDY6093795.1 hypothetical protein [Candidatus Enteromonas sp.]
MKKNILIPALSCLALLASCSNPSPSNSSVESSETPAPETVTFATPTGAPTLAFYDQATNPNWFSSSQPATQILPLFTNNNYDAVVFDGTQALTNISTNQRDYTLAKWISSGAFYVVSTKHDATYVPTSKPRVYAFMPQGNISKAFRTLAKNAWNWGEYGASSDEFVTYGAAVSDVQAALASMIKAGSTEGDLYDYYLIADPAYSALSAQFKKANLTLHTIYDMNAEFQKKYSCDIPAAAIFLNKTNYASKKASIDAWLDGVQKAMDVVAADLDAVIPAVKATDAGDGSNAKFGVSSAALTIVKNRTGKDQNPFRYHKTGEISTAAEKASFANAFQTAIGEKAFGESLFSN